MHSKDKKIGTEGDQNGIADPETNVPLARGDADKETVIREAKMAGAKH